MRSLAGGLYRGRAVKRKRPKKSPTEETWAAMKNRCKNPSHVAYPRYGGRGIKVCERWAGRKGRLNFIADMGERPPGMTLDRIDPDGDYTPENCRWATPIMQRRNYKNRPLYTAFGRTQGLPEWAEEYGVSYDKIHQRIHRYGWTLEEALTMDPVYDPSARGGWKRVPRKDIVFGIPGILSPYPGEQKQG